MGAPPAAGGDPQAGAGYPPQAGAGYPPQAGAGYPPQAGFGYPPQAGAPAAGGYPPAAGGYPQAAPAFGAKPGKRVITPIYLILILLGWIAAGAFTGIVFANMSRMDEAAPFTWLPIIISQITFLVLLAKAWGSIQDSQSTISAGKAVGFLFIPFFNIYWVFKAIGSWPRHYNEYAQRNGLQVPQMGSGLFIALPVCWLIPGINISFIPLIVMIIVVLKMGGGINRLADG